METTAPKGRFIESAALPVVLALLGAVLVIGTIFTWSNSHTDGEAVSRQQSLIRHVIEEQRDQIKREQEDMVIWDSAAEAIAANPIDMDFIENNLGIGANDFFGHDSVFILDPQLNAIYAMYDGDTVAPETYNHLRTLIGPFAKRLQEINWQGAINAYTTGLNNTPPSLSDIVLFGESPAIISLMPILSDRQKTPPGPGREHIHVTAQFLDANLASKFAEQLLLEGGHFTTDPNVGSEEATVAITNNAGDPIAYYAWVPYQPSATVIKRTTPAIILALIFGGTVIVILMARLRRSTRELEIGRSEAQHLAYHDALTGLGNRITFEKSLEEAVQSLKTSNKESIALFLLDLDRFKQVNDTLGHEAGDELICEVATRLLPLVRETDTVVRLGGDEFGIVARQLTSNEDIAALSNRILQNIRKPFDLRAGQAFVGVSIGISVTNSPTAVPIEMTREADIALYEAKGGGRNQYCVFEERMSQEVLARQTLEADLRAALRTDDQLDVGFAPLVREEGNEVIGAAAEIEWRHPTHGHVPTEEFIHVAESIGLSEIIGEFVLLRACQMGAKTPGQLMAVRAQPAQLRNPYFFDKAFSILNETGMRPHDLELEVSEKILSSTEETISTTLRKLRYAGVRIALNDFGTGFTSLQLLRQFEVDRIKMDRSFIQELQRSPDPEATTHAVIWLARASGVEVTADGVDTIEKKKFLARMGCMSFQGALFSPEGQAELLRHSRQQPHIVPTQRNDDDNFDDIELWDTGS